MSSPQAIPLPTFRDAELVLAGESDEKPGLLPVYLGIPVERVDIEHPPDLEKLLRDAGATSRAFVRGRKPAG